MDTARLLAQREERYATFQEQVARFFEVAEKTFNDEYFPSTKIRATEQNSGELLTLGLTLHLKFALVLVEHVQVGVLEVVVPPQAHSGPAVLTRWFFDRPGNIRTTLEAQSFTPFSLDEKAFLVELVNTAQQLHSAALVADAAK